MLNLIIFSLNYLQYDEVKDYNPLNGSVTQQYEQTFNYKDIGQLSEYYQQNSIKSISLMTDFTYKNATDLSQIRNITQTIVLYKNNETESQYMKFHFSGFYNPELQRGVMLGKILLTPHDNYDNLTDNPAIIELLNDNNYPNNVVFNKINVSENCVDTSCCDDLMNYFTITSVSRSIKRHKYMPDIRYHYSEATPVNSTFENVSFLSQRIISEKCQIDMIVQGSIQNTAFELNSQLIYSFVFIIIQILSLLSGIRQLFLLNSPQRLRKISSVSFLMQTLYDIVMVAFYVNQSGRSVYTKAPIYVSSILLIIMLTVVDGPILVKALQYNHMGQRFFNIAMFSFFILLLLYFVMYEWITDRVNFVIILLSSSYWFVQSIEGIIRDTETKMLTLDFIVMQTIAKYAPVIYFYGIPDNFVGIKVEKWFLPSMIAWFSFQFVLLIIQFFFGGRLISPLLAKYRKNGKSPKKNIYEYDHQHVHLFAIRVIEEFISNDDILRNAQAQKLGVFEYLKKQNRNYPIFFSDAQTLQSLVNNDEDDLGSSELTPKVVAGQGKGNYDATEQQNQQLTMEILQEIKQTCQNPLHEHSLFYNPTIHVTELGGHISYFKHYENIANKWKNRQTCCFYLVPETAADSSFSCSICMDDLEVKSGLNNFIRCFNIDFQDAEIAEKPEKLKKLENKKKNENHLIEKDQAESKITVANENVDSQNNNQYNHVYKKSQKELENQTIFITPCGHMFHKDCIAKWAAEQCQCPIDRQKIPPVPTKAWWE